MRHIITSQKIKTMNEIIFQFLVCELKISKIDFCNKPWKFNPATFSLFSVGKKEKKIKRRNSFQRILCISGVEFSDLDAMSYCMYPDVFNEYHRFREEFGPVTGLPTRLFFVGCDIGEEFEVEIEKGKNLHLKILAIGDVNTEGKREVFCEVNGQLRPFFVEDKKEVKVSDS